MNRLVLIGNGYDIAAGLKTSYEDFLVDYFKGMINHALKLNQLQLHYDELIEVKHSYPTNQMQIFKNESNLKEVLSNKHIHLTPTNEEYSTTEHRDYNQVYVKIKSSLLENLLGNYNWRDIESFYFQKLLEIYNIEAKLSGGLRSQKEREEDKKNRNHNLKKLNKEFEQLRSKIIEYLCKINTDRLRPFKFIEQLKAPMDKELFKKFFNKGEYGISTNNQIENVRFVNFNYTLALENAITNRGQNKLYSMKDILYIHGDVENQEKIIFGYGDDTDPVFKELEKTGEDEYLKHLKSFQYPLSKNYLELMDYIHYDQFEVIIAGHSLGISDRVLLKTIFEHDNCKAIRILHRGRHDEEKRIQNKYMALARHFDNKMIMRNKIVPFDMSDELH